MRPSDFRGTINPLEVKAWLMQIENFFDVIDCTEVQKASFTIFMLKGEVKHWWRATRGTLHLKEDEPIT